MQRADVAGRPCQWFSHTSPGAAAEHTSGAAAEHTKALAALNTLSPHLLLLLLLLLQLQQPLDRSSARRAKCTLAGGKHLRVEGPLLAGSSSGVLLQGELHAAVRSFEEGSVWDVVREGAGQVGGWGLAGGMVGCAGTQVLPSWDPGVACSLPSHWKYGMTCLLRLGCWHACLLRLGCWHACLLRLGCWHACLLRLGCWHVQA